MHSRPEVVLPASHFLPGTLEGPAFLKFPYAIALGRIALNPRLHNILRRRTPWSGLYDEDHPSGALDLMAAICEGFVRLATARGKRALIVMLPLSHSFREQAHHGAFEYAPLVAALRARNIEVFDPGPAMLDALAGRSPCEFYSHPRPEMSWLTSPVPCGGHYSSAGNAILAQLVAAELKDRNMVEKEGR
jgi:hypothetical protein